MIKNAKEAIEVIEEWQNRKSDSDNVDLLCVVALFMTLTPELRCEALRLAPGLEYDIMLAALSYAMSKVPRNTVAHYYEEPHRMMQRMVKKAATQQAKEKKGGEDHPAS